MQVLTVEIDNEYGLHLLQDLEKLNVLRILKDEPQSDTQKTRGKYRGVFTKEDAKSFMDHTATMRGEWKNI